MPSGHMELLQVPLEYDYTLYTSSLYSVNISPLNNPWFPLSFGVTHTSMLKRLKNCDLSKDQCLQTFTEPDVRLKNSDCGSEYVVIGVYLQDANLVTNGSCPRGTTKVCRYRDPLFLALQGSEILIVLQKITIHVSLLSLKHTFIQSYTTYLEKQEINMAMVFNVTFNNISVISWQTVLLVEETRVHGEKYRLAASH